MSHHFDAPGLEPPSFDPAVARVHVSDLYAFGKPADAKTSVLIMTVNPLAVADSFDPSAVYEIKVDADGDAVAETAFRVMFTGPAGEQTATLRRADGEAAAGTGIEGEVLVADAPVSYGREPLVATAGDFRLFAGVRGDPFFADFEGFANDMSFTGADFFGDKNVFGIAVEVPNAALADAPEVGLWARISSAAVGLRVRQVDRLAQPLLDVLFNADDPEKTFNTREPTGDRDAYLEKFVHVFEHVGHPPDEARRLADGLLPDLLRYDTSRGADPRNGRTLERDVVDEWLALITAGKITSDGAGPKGDLLDEFPYLAPPR